MGMLVRQTCWTARLTAFTLVITVLCVNEVWMQDSGLKRMCYFTTWSKHRVDKANFTADMIPPSLCTHIIFAFATFDDRGNFGFLSEKEDLLTVETFRLLKLRNTRLKTLLAVGGWDMGSETFSRVAANPHTRQTFAASATAFLRLHGFDGLDIDWEYPTERGGDKYKDKENFGKLLKEVKGAFIEESYATGSKALLLTASVPASKFKADVAYNVTALNKYLDFMTIMTYDFHGDWENTTGQNSPLYASILDKGDDVFLNTNASVHHWQSKGMAREKIVVGLATYGRSFTLSGSSSGLGSSATTGPAGTYIRLPGFWSYYEICSHIDKHRGSVRYDVVQQVPFYSHSKLWVGYDNIRSIKAKARYIRDKGFGGFTVWALDLDDFSKMCTHTIKAFPLIRAAAEEFGVVIPDEYIKTHAPQTTGDRVQMLPTATRKAESVPQPQTVQFAQTTRTVGTIDTSSKVGEPPAGTVMAIRTELIPLMKEQVVNCPPTSQSFFSNPMDCSRFYQCNEGKRYAKQCPQNLHWDEKSNACNYPELAGCDVSLTTK